jgi:hypothetical protein
MKKLKMRNEEVTQLLEADVTSFPKYATQLINLANQNAQVTRPGLAWGMGTPMKIRVTIFLKV